VLEAIRARALPTPVLLVTGNANEAYLKLAMEAGASGLWQALCENCWTSCEALKELMLPFAA
jgi:DNA-binding NarL/FixJ family response regulator